MAMVFGALGAMPIKTHYLQEIKTLNKNLHYFFFNTVGDGCSATAAIDKYACRDSKT